jgi:putative transposase
MKNMPRREAAKITLSDKEREILTKINTGTHTAMNLIKRSGIILLAEKGESNNRIEKVLQIHGETVTQWRNRYAQAHEELVRVEKEEPRKFRAAIEKTLSDAPRPGTPPTFTDEQVACIIALACEKPEQLDLPFSHWTPTLLREEIIKSGVVKDISAMHVSRLLKRARIKASSGTGMAQSQD